MKNGRKMDEKSMYQKRENETREKDGTRAPSIGLVRRSSVYRIRRALQLMHFNTAQSGVLHNNIASNLRKAKLARERLRTADRRVHSTTENVKVSVAPSKPTDFHSRQKCPCRFARVSPKRPERNVTPCPGPPLIFVPIYTRVLVPWSRDSRATPARLAPRFSYSSNATF